MRNIRLTVQYEGTRYRGWQRLGDSEMTVQGKLEALLARFCGEEVHVTGSGRTDAGVHALGQAANFHTASGATSEEFLAAFNEYLPEDIAVTEVEDVPERFHARYNAVSKTYRYRLDTGFVRDPFSRRWALHHPGLLDTEAIRAAVRHLEGEHDFRSFTIGKYKNKSTSRNLVSVRIVPGGRFLDFLFTGSGFLHGMARILAGTLLAAGRGEIAPDAMPGILEARDRAVSGPSLPAHGLTLLAVEY